MMTTMMTHARLHRLDHLSVKELRQLDREKTIVVLPVGMLEVHGDHLPLGTDTFAAEASTLAAASWLLDNDPNLHVLMMPLIPYGIDPVDNHRPDLFHDAGSVWISRETLKGMVADVSAHMVRFGFKYIFPIGFHGGPEQSVALDETCADMRAKHKGLVMFEPMGYVMAGGEKDISPGIATLLGRPLTPKEEVALQTSIHGSMFETSMMLYLRPELVHHSYKKLRTIEWREMFEMKDWPGYVGAGPSHSDADVGGAVLHWRGVRAGAMIRRAMQGDDLSALPRHPTWQQQEGLKEEIRPISVSMPIEEHIDSKPEIFFDGDEVRKRASQAIDESDTDVDPLRDTTPSSSAMKTEPRMKKSKRAGPSTPPDGVTHP